MNRTVALLSAIALGVLASLSFAPVRAPGAFLIALVGLIALLRYRRIQDAGRWFALYLAGFTASLYGIATWWLNAVSLVAWFLLTLFSVLVFAALGWALRWCIDLAWWPLCFASLWTIFDLARSSVPFNGFPWLRLSHAVLDTPADGVVRWIGLVSTTWLLALLSALVVAAVEQRSLILAGSAVGIVVVASLAPTGLVGGAGSLRVAAVQGNTPGPFGTWRSGEIFDLHLEETRQINEAVDLVIWPENASDIDILNEKYAGEQVRRVAEHVNAPILVGAILDGPDADTAINASVPVTPTEGPRDDIYIKQALVPYGEFVPFRSILGDLVPRFDREIPRDMVPGTEPGAVEIAGTIVGTVICWDVAQDHAVRGSAQENASFIAVQTSNATFADFGRGIQPEQQWDISRLRAIETGRWVVVASTNGVSGVIDPHGTEIQRLPTRQPATAIETIELASGQTWATRIEKPVMWLIGILALLGFGAGVIDRRKDRS